MIATLPRLETAAKWLRSRQRAPLYACLERLNEQRKRCRVAVVLHALNPARFEEAAYRVPKKDEYIIGDDVLTDACVREIDELAPLDTDMMGMRCEDGMPDELFPACAGFPMGWDEWEEMISEPSTIDASMRLYAFVTILRMGDIHLGAANAEYGWGLSEDECMLSIPDPSWERLCDLLDERGLGCFKNAILACMYDTGNPYFDYNPWDEGEIYDLPAFSLEGVRALQEYWEDAQPIRDDLRAACEMFGKDPSLARTLYDLYIESNDESGARPQTPTPGGGRTLAEMWAADEDTDGPVIDEFYGPIG